MKRLLQLSRTPPGSGSRRPGNITVLAAAFAIVALGFTAFAVDVGYIAMTRTQLQSAEWILLGAMPGAGLLVGWLVWFRRRR